MSKTELDLKIRHKLMEFRLAMILEYRFKLEELEYTRYHNDWDVIRLLKIEIDVYLMGRDKK